MTTVGEANVIVRPVVRDFRAELARGVNASLGVTPLPVPVAPAAAKDALSWQKIAGGAVVPVPIAPTITPEAERAFGSQVGGLRGLLLGSGQFAASRALGISGAAAGLFVFGRAALGAVKSAADLEQELNVFQQVSGATTEQMARVRAEARALGADVRLPAVSAGDAAQTMTELAKAGLSVDQVLRGTRGTLQLAAAAQLDFATSSELVANALNAFQLPGAQATKVADLLAGAANAAQGDIGDFGLALAQAAAVAHQAGIPLGETVTFLTELAKAGISGSDAGTSLRTTILRLIAPTAQAQKIFRELGVEINDAQGNVRPDVFEQLRESMSRLEPATRNQALATIFGADAVRAASVFVRDGAAGHEELARQVERAGQAQEIAAARTKGLSGSVQGLSSNVETLGTDLGAVALPALTELADTASAAVSDVDALVVEVEKLGHAAGGLSLGPFGTVGKLVGDNVKNAVAAPFQPLHAAVDLMRGDFRGAGEDAERTVPGLHELRTAVQDLFDSTARAPRLRDVLQPPGGGALEDLVKGSFGRSGEDVRNAALAGNEIGTTFGVSFADGINKTRAQAVLAAAQTVRAAEQNLREVVERTHEAVQQTIRQGQAGVEAAAVKAKQNLATLATGLQQEVLDILQNGPLGQEIAKLQNQLDKQHDKDERKRLLRDLRQAQDDLKRAQAAIAGGGGSPEQRAAEAEFLQPFINKVDDAKAALGEFNKSSALDKLTEKLNEQKAQIVSNLNDIVARFNQGLISAPDASKRIAALLSKNLGPVKEAGKAQGFAFAQGFDAQLVALQTQIGLIAAGPKTTKTGREPDVVSPAAAAKQAAAEVQAARAQAESQQRSAAADLASAVKEAKRQEHEDLAGAGGVISVLREIRNQLAPPKTPAHRPSSSAQSTAPRGTRAGGR